MIAIAALAVVQAIAPPAAAAPGDPVAVVTRFLAAVEQDAAAVSSMLAPGAMFGAGHVGGPMNADTLRPFMAELRSICSLTGLAPSEQPLDMPGRTIAVIVGRYRCVSEERPEGHDLEMNYLVENGRIEGIYMPMERPNE